MRGKIVFLVMLAFMCLCPGLGLQVNAAGNYQMQQVEGQLICTYDEVQQKNVYFAVKVKDGVYTVVKPGTSGSSIYYFDENGNGSKHKEKSFVKVSYNGSKATYYSEKGKIAKNKIVGNKKQGYYYVDQTGVKVTSKEIKQAVKFVRAHTKSGWSKSKKLKACYKYLWKNYTYERFYDKAKASKMPSYARYMFSKKRGNCYRYAASLAYIARVIGYDSRVVSGGISSLHRSGFTAHGWTEIKIDGKWYIFDANMQRNFPTVDSYKKTESTYAYKHETYCKYKMTVKNGKVTWK